jgi:hypothetical protein
MGVPSAPVIGSWLGISRGPVGLPIWGGTPFTKGLSLGGPIWKLARTPMGQLGGDGTCRLEPHRNSPKSLQLGLSPDTNLKPPVE